MRSHAGRPRRGLFFGPFGELADPRRCAELAVAAEQHGWDGVFLWDHVLRPDPPMPVADPWIALAAIAAATERVRLGPMVTPITRRRPIKVAREVTSLDWLSGGRLILGLGLGVDTARELSAFGEEVDPRRRAQRLDEGIGLLTSLWTGDPVDHHGDSFVADGVTALPRPLQRPHPPIWLAARTTNAAPLRRAARHDGVFAIEVGPDELEAMLEEMSAHRGSLAGFEVATVRRAGIDVGAFERAGVTWWMTDIAPGSTVADAEDVIARGWE